MYIRHIHPCTLWKTYLRLYISLYTCMHAYGYISLYTCMHACIHIDASICTHACMHMGTSACTHACMHMGTSTSHMHACIWVHQPHTCVHACIHIDASICTHACSAGRYQKISVLVYCQHHTTVLRYTES